MTVERMQTTVQSLEELARQSRINYTVVGGSPYEEYFKNMAGAEEVNLNQTRPAVPLRPCANLSIMLFSALDVFLS